MTAIVTGQFSASGDVYVVASQDMDIMVLDANQGYDLIKRIDARDVHWTVTSTDVSPDERFVLYSTISDVRRSALPGFFCAPVFAALPLRCAACVRPCTCATSTATLKSTTNCTCRVLLACGAPSFRWAAVKSQPAADPGRYARADVFLFGPARTCTCVFVCLCAVFCIGFSPFIFRFQVIIYDVERKTVADRVEAHTDDINAVCYADQQVSCSPRGACCPRCSPPLCFSPPPPSSRIQYRPYLIVSGSDDSLIKVRDVLG